MNTSFEAIGVVLRNRGNMNQLKKAASIAAFLIVAGMLIHNLNALYLEPYTLGFVDKAKDYADMAKIENALWSFSFTSTKRSLHMRGRAIDLRLTDVRTKTLREAALEMRRGGVGYYPRSDFVHLDTGRIRAW